MPEYAAGQYVSWTVWEGSVATVEVMAADRSRISYRAADDHREAAEATVLRTLAEQTAHRRPATEHPPTAPFPRSVLSHA
ncbi:hypothetical protein [Streptomyces sp. NPDC093094]|uniref:hypothetical protein n=1 Tax=Streptomyces sp. NPDC093094 TaxID=3366026 RepID=UPI0038269C98